MNPIAELQRLLCNLIRIGTVIEIDHEHHRARVETGENETDWLQWAEQNAAGIITSNPPALGETWLLLSPSGELEQAILALRLTSDEHPALPNTGAEKKTTYPDGTQIGYNHETHALSVNVPESGQCNITVNGPVTVSAPRIDLGENGLEPSVLGDKMAAWVKDELKVWLDTHQHIGNLGAPTSAAVAPFIEGTAAQGSAVYSTKNRNQ